MGFPRMDSGTQEFLYFLKLPKLINVPTRSNDYSLEKEIHIKFYNPQIQEEGNIKKSPPLRSSNK